MGCSASKASSVIVPMPEKFQKQEKNGSPMSPVQRQNSGGKRITVKESEDSLRGSMSSLPSISDSANKSDRESSAKSTRTTDSGLGELDDPEVVTEYTTDSEKLKKVNIDERPLTPDLCVEGAKVARRKGLKDKRVSFGDRQEFEEVKNRINSLAPLGGIIERPQSRGGMAFDILCPETRNVKKRPNHLRKLDKKRKKSKRMTKEQLDEKMKNVDQKRQEHNQQIREKAIQMVSKDRQAKVALDEFARRQMEKESLESC